jgi:hypothetical protein
MSGFGTGQLDVGEFVYDAALPAMRATVYGLESGAADLLIAGEESYLLSGPHGAPTGCTSLGRSFRPLKPQWLAAESRCVGEAPLATMPVQWWKTPASAERADWHWFRTDTRLPWRSMRAAPSTGPAVIGDYALTYYPSFSELPATNLSRLRDFCAARAKADGDRPAAAATTARDLMALGNAAAEAERSRRIAELIPGLSAQNCARMTPVRWPDQFLLTAIISPNLFEDDPFPSVVAYDWTGARAQGAVLYDAHRRPPSPALVFLLKQGIGYDVRRVAPDTIECRPIYPGVVRPDWMANAQCQCKGVIAGGTPLSPHGETQILACPIRHQEPRVMWNWYTAEGRPQVFAEALASGSGLMLADYFEWSPGTQVPPAQFELLPQCKAPSRHEPLPTRSCGDCHTLQR